MAVSAHCSTCLRLVRQQSRRSQKIYIPISIHPQRIWKYSSSTVRPLATQVVTNQPTSTASPLKTKPGLPSQKVNHKPDTTSPVDKLAKTVRKHATGLTESYVAYGALERLVKECARQADYTIPQAHEKGAEIPKTKDEEDLGVGTGWWYDQLGLTPTFNTWAQITFLHMYLLTVRIRCFSAADAPVWHQQLIDHFSYTAEERMTTMHHIHARMIRNKYLKDLFVQWRGLTAAYDEGLVQGDAVLAAAVWRNVFKGDENVDIRKLGQVVSYVRGVLHQLDRLEDTDIVSADVVFGDPGSEAALVKVRSRMMDTPFTEEELGEGESIGPTGMKSKTAPSP